VQIGNEWYYDEFTKGAGVTSWAHDGSKVRRTTVPTQALPRGRREATHLATCSKTELRAEHHAGCPPASSRGATRPAKNSPWPLVSCHCCHRQFDSGSRPIWCAIQTSCSGFCRLITIWLRLANTRVTMPPTRWLSMSAVAVIVDAVAAHLHRRAAGLPRRSMKF